MQIYIIDLNTPRKLLLLFFCISQSCVLTHLRCGMRYDTILVANLLSPTVKEFLKSVNVSQSYERILSDTFLWPTVYKLITVDTEQ